MLPDKIILTDQDAINLWCEKLSCKENDLRYAIRAIGNDPDLVNDFLILNRLKLTRENDPLIARIKQLRAYYNCDITEFSRKCNLRPIILLKAESGFTEKLQKRTLRKILMACNVAERWLLYGEGRMTKDDAELGAI